MLEGGRRSTKSVYSRRLDFSHNEYALMTRGQEDTAKPGCFSFFLYYFIGTNNTTSVAQNIRGTKNYQNVSLPKSLLITLSQLKYDK